MPILQKEIDNKNSTLYIEPFVGGANIIDKIKCNKKVGYDIHPQLIAMWKALQEGWKPPDHISEEEYNNVKSNKDNYPDYYVGYVGFNATFGAKYFGGYARSFKDDGVTPRDQSNEAYRNIMKQLPNVLNVQFINDTYLSINSNVSNAIIYCDPPYKSKTKYKTEEFDYEQFWDWCRNMGERNELFISEYDAPEDFTCIWEKESLANFDSKRGDTDKEKKKRIEKLFIYHKK